MSSRRKHSLHFAVPLAVTLALAGTAGAAGQFDGTYRGSQTVRLNNNYQGCSDSNDAVLIVRNNHFTRRWAGDSVINVDVANDGTFNGQASFIAGRNRQATVSITGKIAGGGLEADMGSDRCQLHLSLKKS